MDQTPSEPVTPEEQATIRKARTSRREGLGNVIIQSLKKGIEMDQQCLQELNEQDRSTETGR